MWFDVRNGKINVPSGKKGLMADNELKFHCQDKRNESEDIFNAN